MTDNNKRSPDLGEVLANNVAEKKARHERLAKLAEKQTELAQKQANITEDLANSNKEIAEAEKLQIDFLMRKHKFETAM